MSMEILVLCLFETDYGLISRAVYLAEAEKRKVHVVVTNRKKAKAALSYGADEVDIMNLPQGFSDEYAVAVCLGKKIKTQWKSEIILAPADVRMRVIMPMLAGFLKAGLTADCTELTLDEKGELLQIRPAMGNNLLAFIKSLSEIKMATVRPGIYHPVEKRKRPCSIGEFSPELKGRVRLLSFLPQEETSPLSQARVVLAGGMGIGSRENFEILASVAKKTGAALGASRMAVNAGFAPYACQVGQTGVTVHPDLYIAVGISGAVQHLAGMSGSVKVVAINNDSCASIFDYADYGIVADWKEVLKDLPG